MNIFGIIAIVFIAIAAILDILFIDNPKWGAIVVSLFLKVVAIQCIIYIDKG